jgi:hypothetical protein
MGCKGRKDRRKNRIARDRGRVGEEDVIILVAFERRVKIYKVNRFIFDIAAEYFQVIAVIQNVFCHNAPLFYSKQKEESLIIFL